MLNVLLSCFMSFAVLGSSAGVNFIDSRAATPQAYSNQPSISYEAVQVADWRNGLIGNYRMVQITTSQYMGVCPTQYYSDFLNSATIDELRFTKTVTSIKSSTVSTVAKEESCIITGLQVRSSIPGAQINCNLEVVQGYTIGMTSTYTTTPKDTVTISFNIKPEYLDGRNLAIGQVADVYEITYDTWVMENWWWGQYETSGTRRTGKAYITYNPFVTLIYQDGEIVL